MFILEIEYAFRDYETKYEVTYDEETIEFKSLEGVVGYYDFLDPNHIGIIHAMMGYEGYKLQSGDPKELENFEIKRKINFDKFKNSVQVVEQNCKDKEEAMNFVKDVLLKGREHMEMEVIPENELNKDSIFGFVINFPKSLDFVKERNINSKLMQIKAVLRFKL